MNIRRRMRIAHKLRAMPVNEPDGELIRRSLGDPRPFAAIFERHFDAIFRYLARRIGPDDASDLASEVFSEALRTRDRFDCTASSAAPWLFGIASNLLRQHARSRRRLFSALARTSAEPSVWYDPDVASRVDAEMESAAIERALESLRAVDRDIFLLSALAELPYKDIATALNIPIGTVRSRLSRSRQQIRREIEAARLRKSKPLRAQRNGHG